MVLTVSVIDPLEIYLNTCTYHLENGHEWPKHVSKVIK